MPLLILKTANLLRFCSAYDDPFIRRPLAANERKIPKSTGINEAKKQPKRSGLPLRSASPLKTTLPQRTWPIEEALFSWGNSHQTRSLLCGHAIFTFSVAGSPLYSTSLCRGIRRLPFRRVFYLNCIILLIYLPTMSNSRFTTVPFSIWPKLV